ncbi:oxidoreductase-like protein 29 [Elsinoe australis]|uniref:Oxidoreductase-like protein 29 n=1 Tax=Elsinoe australis TaxID=40998 RepID=A0A4U7AKG9_9PEZI|nr:oxidoreductase-like protein 29 [Elsinoe australis]
MGLLGSSNTFEPKDIPDLSGKVYIVTGGSAGIGFGIVAHLLQRGASKIYLLSNKEDHADEAQRELTKYGNVDKVEWKKCNLADLKQTDEVAKELSSLKQIDALILNAGLGVGKFWLTEDGIDSHMQVNHFSQFHLAMVLLPILQRTPNSRLVLQSSDLHRGGNDKVKFASLEEMNTDIGAMQLYNRTKLAQVLFVLALARRASKNQLGFTEGGTAHGPFIIATHPGGVTTDQQEQAVEAYGTLGKIGVKAVRPLMKDPVDEGCRPALFAATSEDIVKEKLQGVYVVPDRKVTDPSKEAKNEELQEALWTLSEQLLTERLGPLPYASKVG